MLGQKYIFNLRAIFLLLKLLKTLVLRVKTSYDWIGNLSGSNLVIQDQTLAFARLIKIP